MLDFKAEDIKLQEQVNNQFPVESLFGADPTIVSKDTTTNKVAVDTDVDEDEDLDLPKGDADKKGKSSLDDISMEDIDNLPIGDLVDENEDKSKNKSSDSNSKTQVKSGNENIKPDTNPIVIVANTFKDKGMLELPDDFDGTDEALYSAFETTVETRADKFIDSVFDNTDEKDTAIALFNHLKNGGKVSDFVDTFSTDYSNVDIKDDNVQKQVLKEYYRRTTKLDNAKIDSKIKKLEDGLLLESEASDALDQINLMDKEKKEAFKQQIQQETIDNKKRVKEYIDGVKTYVDKTEAIKGFLPIKDKKVKEQFLNYMLKPSVKLDDGRLVTQSYADNLKEQDDMESHLVREYLRFKKYNLEGVKKTIKSEVVETLADKLAKSSKEGARQSMSNDEDSNIDLQAKNSKNVNDGWRSVLRPTKH